MTLRPYQQRAIDQLYQWLSENDGHPCLVLPTGAGKSHIIAELCRDAITNWPDTRLLMLTHVKELIEQNAAKLRACWPNVPLGIYSASIGRRQLDEPITFAGIQSVRKRANEIGHIDLIICDECHLISHLDTGGYRKLIAELTAINPQLRVIGLTATPYRLGHGLITDDPAIFDAIIEPTSIEELIYLNHLAPLRSKSTGHVLDASKVRKRGGEYIESELQKAVNTDVNNRSVVQEIIARAGERKSWLVFCSGIDHAHAVCQELITNGITSECLTGKTSKTDRQRIIEAFKAGRIKALTNVSVLTTGFDYPDIDLIAMLRPTMSPGLYVQMAGRGLRPKSHTDHCLVLDFAGVVATHGPITAVQPPDKQGGDGEAPTKTCPECQEIVAASRTTCPNCGHEFQVEKKEQDLRLRNDDIMGIEPESMEVSEWKWRVHESRNSGKKMLAVRYYGNLFDPVVEEYFCVLHGGYAGEKASRKVAHLSTLARCQASDDLEETAKQFNQAQPPETIRYKRDGKFYRVVSRQWTVGESVVIG